MTTNRIGSQIQPEIKEKARALKLFREKKQKLRSQANSLQLISKNEENSGASAFDEKKVPRIERFLDSRNP